MSTAQREGQHLVYLDNSRNELDYGSLSTSDIVSRVIAMRAQEKSRYTCRGYLANSRQHDQEFDEKCREQMCMWFFSIVDHFGLSAEVVLMAMSYLDRFFCIIALRNKKMFKLAATSSLYLAAKVHESKLYYSLAAALPELVRHEFRMSHIADMELLLLYKLRWLVHPPTAISFVRHYFALFPEIPHVDLEDVREVAMYFAQLTAIDYCFVTKRQSSIAIAAILNAVDCTSATEIASVCNSAIFEAIARHVPDFREDTEDIAKIRSQLWTLYDRNGDPGIFNARRSRKSSPTSPSPSSVMMETGIQSRGRCVA